MKHSPLTQCPYRQGTETPGRHEGRQGAGTQGLGPAFEDAAGALKIPMLYAQTEKVERTFNGKINRKYYIR